MSDDGGDAGEPTETPDGSVLNLNAFEQGIERSIEKLGGRVKHCGRSAIHHLRRACALRGVDDEMCGFRAITAEEEAASALLLSLGQKQYPGGSKLNFRDHVQKAAVTPFLQAVENILAVSKVSGNLHLNPNADPPRVDVEINTSSLGLDLGELRYAQPDEPLNFVIHTTQVDGRRDVLDFADELRRVTRAESVDHIVECMRREANLRNQLLYASDTGIPRVTIPERFLEDRRQRVFRLLLLTIAVQQTPRHQLFSVQCLRAFLRLVKRIEVPHFDFHAATAPIDGLNILVEQQDGAAPRTSVFVRRTFSLQLRFSAAVTPVVFDCRSGRGTHTIMRAAPGDA